LRRFIELSKWPEEEEEEEGKEPLPELLRGDDDEVRPKCMLSIFARSSVYPTHSMTIADRL
jgi:hypothetical protein